ncbi:MAG: hypothetical protein WCJ14_08045 [Verrucomicrobiota bacterium]
MGLRNLVAAAARIQDAISGTRRKSRLGFAKRQAFLFKDGQLVWRDLSASTEQQAADVLKVLAGPR